MMSANRYGDSKAEDGQCTAGEETINHTDECNLRIRISPVPVKNIQTDCSCKDQSSLRPSISYSSMRTKCHCDDSVAMCTNGVENNSSNTSPNRVHTNLKCSNIGPENSPGINTGIDSDSNPSRHSSSCLMGSCGDCVSKVATSDHCNDNVTGSASNNNSSIGVNKNLRSCATFDMSSTSYIGVCDSTNPASNIEACIIKSPNRYDNVLLSRCTIDNYKALATLSPNECSPTSSLHNQLNLNIVNSDGKPGIDSNIKNKDIGSFNANESPNDQGSLNPCSSLAVPSDATSNQEYYNLASVTSTNDHCDLISLSPTSSHDDSTLLFASERIDHLSPNCDTCDPSKLHSNNDFDSPANVDSSSDSKSFSSMCSTSDQSSPAGVDDKQLDSTVRDTSNKQLGVSGNQPASSVQDASEVNCDANMCDVSDKYKDVGEDRVSGFNDDSSPIGITTDTNRKFDDNATSIANSDHNPSESGTESDASVEIIEDPNRSQNSLIIISDSDESEEQVVKMQVLDTSLGRPYPVKKHRIATMMDAYQKQLSTETEDNHNTESDETTDSNTTDHGSDSNLTQHKGKVLPPSQFDAKKTLPSNNVTKKRRRSIRVTGKKLSVAMHLRKNQSSNATMQNNETQALQENSSSSSSEDSDNNESDGDKCDRSSRLTVHRNEKSNRIIIRRQKKTFACKQKQNSSPFVHVISSDESSSEVDIPSSTSRVNGDNQAKAISVDQIKNNDEAVIADSSHSPDMDTYSNLDEDQMRHAMLDHIVSCEDTEWVKRMDSNDALDRTTEICSDFLDNNCYNNSACHKHHTLKEYQWQHYNSSIGWKNFSRHENDAVEMCYVNPGNEQYMASADEPIRIIDFKTMMATDRNDMNIVVRRLSTPSAAVALSHSKYNMSYCWYKLVDTTNDELSTSNNASNDEAKSWVSYDLLGGISAKALEIQYDTYLQLQTLSNLIDFEKMVERRHYEDIAKDEIPVRRRPASEMCLSHGFKPSKVSEICVGFLSSTCTKSEACPYYHVVRPYQWQHRSNNTSAWMSLITLHNDQIEASYCDPSKDHVDILTAEHGLLTIPFDKFLNVRRLSTASASDFGHNTYLTEWLWYKNLPSGSWVQLTDVSCQIVNKAYERYSTEQTNDGDIDFITMRERLSDNPVKRRPKLKHNPAAKELSVERELYNEICLGFLGAMCPSKECRYHHVVRPYQWQYRNDQQEWISLSTQLNDHVEDMFTSPANDVVKIEMRFGPITINFDKFELSSHCIRRLSTPSPKAVNFKSPYLTHWCWYWHEQENGSSWPKYFLSDDIEDYFTDDPTRNFIFHHTQYKYEIDFRQMIQINTQLKTIRRVRRRPASFQDKQLSIPPHWTLTSTDTKQFQLIEIGPSDEEYGHPKRRFNESSPNNVLKIFRVENPILLRDYQRKRNDMRRDNGKEPNEKLLFHGTKSEKVVSICTNGFDIRHAGSTNGTMYGKGSYFAQNSAYARRYSGPHHDPNRKFCGQPVYWMFAARVLCGDVAHGHQNLGLPPTKDDTSTANTATGDRFDSCVDNPQNPSIYVIFDTSQAYPAYIIEYH